MVAVDRRVLHRFRRPINVEHLQWVLSNDTSQKLLAKKLLRRGVRICLYKWILRLFCICFTSFILMRLILQLGEKFVTIFGYELIDVPNQYTLSEFWTLLFDVASLQSQPQTTQFNNERIQFEFACRIDVCQFAAPPTAQHWKTGARHLCRQGRVRRIRFTGTYTRANVAIHSHIK